jgi:hypothetical protein
MLEKNHSPDLSSLQADKLWVKQLALRVAGHSQFFLEVSHSIQNIEIFRYLNAKEEG